MPRSFRSRGPVPGAQSQTEASGPTPDPVRFEYALFYELDAGFGAYMKGLRDGRGLSLRAAAAHLGVPFSYLQRLETGGRAAKPDLPLLEKMAALFGVAASEVEARAGVRREPLADPNRLVNDQFRALVMHPAWRAPGMTDEWIESFSSKQKRQIVHMMRQLGEQLNPDSPLTPNRLLTDAGLLTPGRTG